MTAFHFDAEPLPPAGNRVIVPAGIENKAELLTFLQDALTLPDYFGHNWDALEECLTDPDWRRDKVLILAHQDIPLAKTPAEQKNYLLIMTSAAAETTGHFAVHFPETTRSYISQILQK